MGKGKDPADDILDEEAKGDGTSPEMPKPIVSSNKQGSIVPQGIKTTNLVLQNESSNKLSCTNKGGQDVAFKGSRRGSNAQEEKGWSLKDLNLKQMKLLNEKLDDFQEKPRNRSEPKLKYVPSPDFRPQALAEAEPPQRALLEQKLQE